MDVQEIFSVLFRWGHIVAGILWIGLLYFFNFVNTPFSGTIDADTKKKIVPELMPRALFFFRWGAAVTWVTGLFLLGLVFYGGGLMFEQGVEPWSAGSYIMLAVVFLLFPVYDAIAKSGLGKDLKIMGAIGIVVIALVVYLMNEVGHFSYRAYVIHTGVMLGTIMAANVWMRIWPAQKKIIAATKEGTPADAALVATAGQRSRHNTYLSVPLFYMMIDAHTATTVAVNHWAYLLVVVVIGWLVTWRLYGIAGKVKGM